MKTRITKASAARQAAHAVIVAANKRFPYKDCGNTRQTEVIKVGWQGGPSWETPAGYIWRLIGYGKSSFGWEPETVLWSTSDPNQAVMVAKAIDVEEPARFTGLEDEIAFLIRSHIESINRTLAAEKPEWLPCHLERIFLQGCAV